jgi:exonuclease III
MSQLKVVSWNCWRATADSPAWDYLLELDPSVALLQEVRSLPPKILDRFACDVRPAAGKTGAPQRFGTALLVRGRIGDAIRLAGHSDWIDVELERFAGNLVGRELFPRDGPPLKAVSVYSPAWPIKLERAADIDSNRVKLPTNPDVWLADILWASLQHHRASPTDRWIVAGDFNMSETFDQMTWSNGGNREYLDRMAALGLTECLRKSRGVLTPTFRNTCGGAIKHQMDHVFVTEALAAGLESCDVGSQERVFGAGLSDHLPVVARFNL